MFTCWKCNKELPDSTTTCPDCQSNVTKKVVDNMMTIGPGGGPTSQILPGVLVANRYEVKQEIGRGGMGIVYLAHDTIMELDVALKVIPQELCMDPKAVADLKRETSIALKLSHSHIMRLHTLDTWEGQAFVVMELVDGGTLAHLMADKGKLTLEEALVYLRQIATALDYSHSSDPAVVHRDLKPLNILLNKNGDVKIADYGLARVLRDSASRISNQDNAGTLSYMAPEQVKGKGIGKAVDIYALAAIAYEMLSGTPPFYTGDLRWQIVHEEPEAIEGQPDHVNKALLTALSKDREDRPETAGEFMAQLAGEQEIGKRPKKKKKKTRRKASGGRRQKQTGVMIGGVLLVVILAVGGWFLFGKDLGYKSIFQSDPILTVSSDPSGATVYVDEGKVGETPVVIDDLPNGTHTVMLEKEKYTSHEEKIFIQQGQPVNLNSSLIPAPFGDLNVTSDPAGATILMDGKEMGITPATLERLEKGLHQIVLEKEEYDPWQGKAEIVPLVPVNVSGNLLSVYGRVEIVSNPTGAEVFIDDQKSGTTPFTSDRIRKGTRNVELRLSGFEPWHGEALVSLEKTALLNPDLATVNGSLVITTTPSGVEIYLDGKKQGRSPLTIDEVRKGEHQLEFKLKDFESKREKVAVVAGQEQPVVAVLVSSFGSVIISSTPSGAELYLEGKKQGVTPLTLKKLRKGKREVVLKLKGYNPETLEIKVTAGQQNEKITITLSKERFALNKPGIAIDHQTLLYWPISASNRQMSFSEAEKYCAAYSGGGYTDWRMPTSAEMSYSLFGGLTEQFITLSEGNYFTREQYPDGTFGTVDKNGETGRGGKTLEDTLVHFVIPVRGEPMYYYPSESNEYADSNFTFDSQTMTYKRRKVTDYRYAASRKHLQENFRVAEGLWLDDTKERKKSRYTHEKGRKYVLIQKKAKKMWLLYGEYMDGNRFFSEKFPSDLVGYDDWRLPTVDELKRVLQLFTRGEERDHGNNEVKRLEEPTGLWGWGHYLTPQQKVVTGQGIRNYGQKQGEYLTVHYDNKRDSNGKFVTTDWMANFQSFNIVLVRDM